MPSTFFGLSIGTSGLYTYQAALNTTGHNISNVQTRGYTRQLINQSASQAISVSPRYGMVGTGVDVTGIRQERNFYYDTKYWNNSSLYGEYSAKEYYMLSVENYFSEVNADGTTETFSKFFSSLSDLARNGAGAPERKQLAVDGQNFTEYINYISNGLKTQQTECNFDIKTTVDHINSVAQEIASLTKQINTIEMKGVMANDLRDARALLVDELSQDANVTVSERSIGEIGSGKSEYTVRLDGTILVDTYEYNTLKCVPRENKLSQSDAEGLYDLQWNNGSSFNTQSGTLTGKLKALFEFRDGNNNENLNGTAAGNVGDMTVTMTGSSCNDLNRLNIPATDGKVTINNVEYGYDSFEVDVDPVTGEYTYTFHLKEALKTNAAGMDARVGEKVDYKGIPYYMGQMNQFIRTFAAAFNGVHNQGDNLSGGKGVDFFNGTYDVTGGNYNLDESPLHFSSVPGAPGADGLVVSSYYDLTCSNFAIAKSILSNPETIATAGNINNGVDDTSILKELIALKDDKGMFKQGTPDAFLYTLTVDVGINAGKAGTFARSQGNVLKSISIQRMQISGVDEDEEAANLVKYKHAYDLSAKVIQVMNELYNKLINDMI